MNQDTGMFEQLEKEDGTFWDTIEVGEVVKIKGTELRVVSITSKLLTLEIVPARERMMAEFEAIDNITRMRAARIAGKL